jgi:hypothetical protein
MHRIRAKILLKRDLADTQPPSIKASALGNRAGIDRRRSHTRKE